MKNLLKFIFIIVTALLMQWYLPWWSIVIASFLICSILYTNGFSSFIISFLAVALLWGVQAYMIDSANESILSTRVAQLFGLSNPFLMVLITALVGGIAAGFGGLTGSMTRNLVQPDRRFDNKYKKGY